MNDGTITSTGAPERKRRPRRWPWLVLAVLCLVVGASVRMARPYRDPRLLGEWRSQKGFARVFHADGRLEVLELPARTLAWPGRVRWWRIEEGELVTGTQTVKSRVTNWFDNLWSSWTKVQVVGLSDSRYQIVEITNTTLRLRPIVRPGGPPRPDEVLQRVR